MCSGDTDVFILLSFIFHIAFVSAFFFCVSICFPHSVDLCKKTHSINFHKQNLRGFSFSFNVVLFYGLLITPVSEVALKVLLIWTSLFLSSPVAGGVVVDFHSLWMLPRKESNGRNPTKNYRSCSGNRKSWWQSWLAQQPPRPPSSQHEGWRWLLTIVASTVWQEQLADSASSQKAS